MKANNLLLRRLVIFVVLFALLITFYGCSTSSGGDTIVKKEDTIVYTTGKVSNDGTLSFTSGKTTTIIVEAKEKDTLPANSEVYVEERDLYNEEIGIYGSTASKVYTLSGVENVNGTTRLITEVRKPIDITIPNNFPEKYTDFYLGFKSSGDSDWTYINLKEDGTAVVASARMATSSPKQFVISTYRLDYSFTVFAYDPAENITPDSIKSMTFSVVPENYKYNENESREKYYIEDIAVKTLVEANNSSAVFSGSTVSTEITFFTPSANPLAIKINGKDAKDTVSTEKQSDGNYIHKIVFNDYSADCIEASGNLATFSMVLNTKGIFISEFPTDFRLKTILADVKANKFATEYKIEREIDPAQQPVAMDYEIVVPAGSELVATSTVVDIAFKEEIMWSDEPSKYILLKGEKMPVVPVGYSISDDNKHLVITPLRSLRYEDKYKLTVGKCISPKKSDNFFEGLSYEFTTMSGKAASATIYISEDYVQEGLYSLHPVFTINFQKPLASQNLAQSAISVTHNGSPIPFNIVFASENSSVASLSFITKLSSSEKYSISMTETVEDGEGYNIAPFKTLDFTTISNNSVVHTEPEANSINAALNTDISIVFAHDVAWQNSFEELIKLKDSKDNEIDCNYSYSSSNRCLKLCPKENLYYSEKYKVVISNGIENQYTGQIVVPTSFSFSTMESEYQIATIVADEGTVYDDTASPKFVFVQNNGFIIDFVKTPKDMNGASSSIVIISDNVEQNWNKVWLDDKRMKITPQEKLSFGRIYNIRMSDGLRAVDNSYVNQFVPLNVQCFYYEGKGTDDEPFEVTNAEQFDRIRYFKSNSFILTNDIDFAGYKTPFYFDYEQYGFKPIGTEGDSFSGKLFGNEKRIKNLFIVREIAFAIAVFGTVRNATIKDLIIDSTCNIRGGFAVSAIAAQAFNSEIDNCINEGEVSSYYPGSTTGTGSMVSLADNSVIKNCKNKHDLAIASACSGGIVATAVNNTLIMGCANEAKLYPDTNAIYGAFFDFGGIAGIVSSSTISACTNNGLIRYGSAGIVYQVNENSIIKNCINSGDIYALPYFNTGGIAGTVEYSTITNCSNSGAICSDPDPDPDIIGGYDDPNYNYLGGIVGYQCYMATITACINDGDINGDNYVGGITGCLWDNAIIANCINNKNITGETYIGGIAGQRNGCTIEGSVNNGTITGVSNYGDIAGDDVP